MPKGEQVSLTVLPYRHTQGDVPLQPSARVSMSEKNGMQVLEIHEVSQEDVGVYTCMVVNGSGKASMSAELSIQGINCGGASALQSLPGVCTLLEAAACSSLISVLQCHTYIPVRSPGAGS